MSFLARFWNTVRNPVRYIGRDLEGNRFYESRSLIDPSRPRRTIEYDDPENSWRYIGGGKRLAIQWSAWLTHTRRQPPTIEELEGDATRMQRLAENVARIEARDRAEAEKMLRIRQEDAQMALEEAARQGERRLMGAVEDEVVQSTSQTAEAVPARRQVPPPEQSTPTPTLDAALPDQKPKVSPPTFLTPASPRKPKAKKVFSLPTLDEPQAVPPAKARPMEVKTETAQKAADPFPTMPSWPPSETESWTPKARRRG